MEVDTSELDSILNEVLGPGVPSHNSTSNSIAAKPPVSGGGFSKSQQAPNNNNNNNSSSEYQSDLQNLMDEVLGIDTSEVAMSSPDTKSSFSLNGNSTININAGVVRCRKCDFEVIKFENQRWAADVEYLFFRNCYPKRDRLAAKLIPDTKTAWCCQCSWASVPGLEYREAGFAHWNRIN